jgi:hypothetical protein
MGGLQGCRGVEDRVEVGDEVAGKLRGAGEDEAPALPEHPPCVVHDGGGDHVVLDEDGHHGGLGADAV